jgi:hypothetical protein
MANPPLNTTLGVNDANVPPNVFNEIDAFQQQNMSPSDVFSLGNSIPTTLGGIPGLGSRIPSLSKIPIPGASQLSTLLAPINNAKFGVAGNYESVHYADDLNLHHPKFKFLFKVMFVGFPGGSDFQFYVQHCDKPKVHLNHVDVNYYNFRTRVLTSVIYEPMQISFLDEIGNSIVDFFEAYMKAVSGTGAGNYGIDKGWSNNSSSSSSTIPYANGYSMSAGQKIIIEQIFVDLKQGGGPMSNRFTFLNPRIETFDFDELSHEDSSAGSMANITFSYDAIDISTQRDSTLYSWGLTDLFAAGGTSGKSNAGHRDPNPMYNGNPGPVKKPQASVYDALRKGSDLLSNIPKALSTVLSPIVAPLAATLGQASSSAGDVLSSAMSTTLTAIENGTNLGSNQLGAVNLNAANAASATAASNNAQSGSTTGNTQNPPGV